MKKKIVLKRMLHYNEMRLAIIFDYDVILVKLAKSIDGVRWSSTHKCWHSPDDEVSLRQILAVFRDKAEIDISAISVSRDDKTEAPSVIQQNDNEEISLSLKSDIEERYLKKEGSQEATRGKMYSEFAPVLFTISEAEGRLVIKFTGKFDREWIKEFRTYGRPWYDSESREWHFRWSQMTVDSLSDYFYSRGVKVIVKKKKLPLVMAELRNEKGVEVRARAIGKSAAEGIEKVKRNLEEKRYSKRTIESYISGMELFFKYFENIDPSEITEQDISEFIDDYILKLGYSASYQNIIISAIKMFFTLNDHRRVDTDSLKRPKRSRALPKVFSKEEIMEIFSVTKNNKHKLILWLIYSCGLRRSEVINIKLTDLDNDRGVLHIREGKGNVDRMVPIPQKVLEKISAYIKGYKPGIYLFEGQTGGKYSAESVYSVFKHSLKLAGIKKDVGVHSLRHSYATHLHEGGLDIRYIQELLGHKSSRTTEIYTHVSRRNLFTVRSPIEDMDLD